MRLIRPNRRTPWIGIREIWNYRELLVMLVWRDIAIKHKQSGLASIWMFLKPVVSMLVFTLVFGTFANLPSEGVPYALFTFVALLPWTYFAVTLSGVGCSLQGVGEFTLRVYFPRLILPLSRLFSGLPDFLASLVTLGGLMFWFRDHHDVSRVGLLLLPVFLLIAAVTAFALGLCITSLAVKRRGIHALLPYLIQAWTYLTPVAYSATLVPSRLRWLYVLNPMTGVVDGFRWAFLGCAPPDWGAMLMSTAAIVLILFCGLRHFLHTERTLADHP